MIEPLEDRLKSLYTAPHRRREFLESLHEQVLKATKGKVMLPYSLVEALDQILTDTLARQFKKRYRLTQKRYAQTAIVSCHYHTNRVPLPIKKDNENYLIRARFDFVGNHEIITFPSDAAVESIDFAIEVNQKKWKVDYVEKGIIKTLEYHTDEYLRSPSMNGDIIEHSSGAGIRKSDADGKIKFGHESYNLGRANSNQFILVLFDETYEEPFFFNLDGEMVFDGTYERGEASINHRLTRMAEAKEAMDKTDPVNISLLVERRLKEHWFDNPDYFKKPGREYWIEGKANARLTGEKRSYVEVTHYQQGIEKTTLNASSLCSERDVELQFRGPYIAIYQKGEMVNCHAYSEPFNCRQVWAFDDNEIRRVSAITFSSRNEYVRRTIGDKTYQFAICDIEKQAGDMDKVHQFGLIANQMRDSFEIVCRMTDERKVSFPIRPMSVLPYER